MFISPVSLVNSPSERMREGEREEREDGEREREVIPLHGAH